VVVAHHNIFEYITAGRRLCAAWYNCEIREYQFLSLDPSSDADARLELVSPLLPSPSQTVKVPEFSSNAGTPCVASFRLKDVAISVGMEEKSEESLIEAK